MMVALRLQPTEKTKCRIIPRRVATLEILLWVAAIELRSGVTTRRDALQNRLSVG
jgi:hypothetical protein